MLVRNSRSFSHDLYCTYLDVHTVILFAYRICPHRICPYEVISNTGHVHNSSCVQLKDPARKSLVFGLRSRRLRPARRHF